jgi:hypothetical protein
MSILYIQDSVVWADGIVHGGIREKCAQVVDYFRASVDVVSIDPRLQNVRCSLDGGWHDEVKISVGTHRIVNCTYDKGYSWPIVAQIQMQKV